jgi:hypothetical protein
MSDIFGGGGATGPFSPGGAGVGKLDAGGGFNPGQIIGAGVLGAGALGAGALFAQGPSPIPPQFQELQNQVPLLNQEAGQFNADAAALLRVGGEFTEEGRANLARAGRGELTPEQQAQLGQTQTGLTNQARQMYASMGRNPDQDTSFINTTGNIDAQTTAMAQQYIQSTIKLGLGETSAGAQYSALGAQFGQLGLGATGMANQALIEAGKAQLEQNKTYSSSLSGMFQAIGQLAGPLFKAILV